MTDKNSTATSVPARARLNGWLRVAFIASLTLNLLVAGMIVGGIIRHDRHPSGAVVGDIRMGPLTEALSRGDREALRRSAQQESKGFRSMRQAALRDNARLIAALRAEPWDKASIQQVLAGHRDRLLQRSELGERLMLERLGQMSTEERRAFADRLERLTERHQGKRNRPVRDLE